MNPFYDLNKRLASIGTETKQIAESVDKTKSAVVKTLETALAQDLKSLMEGQVNEISDATKDSYAKKAKAEVSIHNRNKNNPGASAKDKEMAAKSAAKREKGLEKVKEDGTGGMNFSGSGSLEEKFDKPVHLNPAKKGMFKGKSKADLEKQLAHLHKSGSHKKGSPEYTKQQELNFAIRAKSGWPKGKTNEAIPMTLEDGISTFESTPGEYVNIKKGMKSPAKMTDVMRGTNIPKKIQQAGKPVGNNPLANVGKGLKAFFKGEPEPMDEAEMMEYLQAKAQSMPYNGPDGAADAYNGMEFESSPNGPHGKPGWLIDAQKRAEGEIDEAVTRQHFQHTAELLKHIEDIDKRMELAKHHAAIFKTANPRFDHNKFMKACGLDECGVWEDDVMTDEGNAFTDKLRHTPKGGKFKMGNKTYTDTSDVDEGFADLDAWMKDRQHEKHSNFDKKKISTGTVYTRKHEDEPEDDKDDIDAPASKGGKTRGRPKKEKAPHRFTKGAWKNKEKADEGADDMVDRGEYDQEGDMVKDNLHTIRREAGDLEKIVRNSENVPEWVQDKLAQAKGMVTAVSEYMKTQHERDVEQETGEEGVEITEKSTSEKQARTMAAAAHNPKFAKKVGIAQNVAKEFNKADKGTKQLSNAMKHKKTEEEATPKRDNKAERAGKKVTKDIEYDEKKKDGIHGKKRDSEDAKAERAGKKVAKDIEYDEKKKSKKEVDENTVAGSVATTSAKSKSSGGMGFGKGIYDSFNRDVESMINESIDVKKQVSENMGGGEELVITVTGDDVGRIKELLQHMGLEGGDDHQHDAEPEYCPSCACDPCECGHEDEHGMPELDEADVDVTENDPDYPSNQEYSNDAFQYSGGLNKPKATGQTTIPVISSQTDRQMSDKMSEARSFVDLYKAIEARTK